MKKLEYEFHEAADLFPMMGQAELEELARDIKDRGLMEPIRLFQGKIIDGRNRYRACKLAGAKPLFRDMGNMKVNGGKQVLTDAGTYCTPTEFVLSLNLHRRHLTAEQKREVIAKVLKSDPKKSNRKVATEVKADDKTVASVRRELEATAEIPHLDRTEGQDGRERPVKKPTAAAPKSPAWTKREQELRQQMEAGRAVVVNIEADRCLVRWAEGKGLYRRADRASPWGNPFVLYDDGDRATVLRLFAENYLPHKRRLLRDAPRMLKGMALGCHCAPERCHAEWWAAIANGEPWPALPEKGALE